MFSSFIYYFIILFNILLKPALAQTSSNNTTPSVNKNLTSTYPQDGVCNKYIDYTVYTKGVPVSVIETQLASLKNLSMLLGGVAPTCVDALYRYSCSFAYPKYDDENNKVVMGCQETCQAVHFSCKNIFIMTGKGQLPDCSKASPLTGLPLDDESACNVIKSTVPNSAPPFYNLSSIPPGFIMDGCPSPFIKDPLLLNHSQTISPFCHSGCCIPCPAQNFFYPEGWTTQGFLVTDILRCISTILSFFFVVSYLVLPEKRGHPAQLILNFSIAIFLFSMVVFFSIGDPQKLQCANSVTPSTQSNNLACAVQGGILIFACLATACWCTALIINLHLQTVWDSNWMATRYTLLHVLCWTYPLVVMIVCLAEGEIKFEFANLCLVNVDKIFDLFFYPMAGLVCPAFLIHLSTFFYIAKVAIKETWSLDQKANPKLVFTAVRIQWRALLLAILSTITVVFYWIFYFTQIDRTRKLMNNPAMLGGWLTCMVSPGGNQNQCLDIVKNYVPPFEWTIIAESLISCLGIYLFVIFGKKTLFIEWKEYIHGKVKARFDKYYNL